MNGPKRSRLDWNRLIANIARATQQALGLNEILQTIVDEVQRLLRCDRVLLCQLESDGSGKVTAEALADPQWSLLRWANHTQLDALWFEPYREGQVTAIADTASADLPPDRGRLFAELEVCAHLAVPILHGSQVWGVLIAQSCTEPQPWATKDVTGLQQIAVHLGIAAHQESLAAQLQAMQAKLESNSRQAELKSRQSQGQVTLSAAMTDPAQDTAVSITLAEDISTRFEPDSLVGANTLLRDIMSQGKAEVVPKEQVDMFRIFYECSPLMLGTVEITDNDILHISHNPATVAFFGTTFEALANQWASVVGVSPDVTQLWLTHYHQSQQQQQPVQFEYEHVTATHSYWLLITVSYMGIAASGRPQCSYIVQDISARRRLEAEQQRADAIQTQAEQVHSELKLLENILDIILAGYWDWDIPGNQEYMSPGFKRMFGYDNHELPNTPETWQQLIFPEDLPGVLECFERHTQSHGEVPYYNEVRYRHKDGSTVWVLCLGKVITWDEAGQPLRMIGCHIDVTDQKQSEMALKDAKDQLELFIQATSEGFWDWNFTTGEMYFSPRWKEMLGYADDEISHTCEMWESLIFEEDRAAAFQLVEDYNSGKVDRFAATQRFRHKDGSLVHILSRAIHLKDEQGQAVRLIGSHLDVTHMVEMQAALKTSEMQLSSILHSSLDGIMAFRSVRDDHGTIIDFEWLLSNPTACDIVGRRAEELIGKRMLDELPGNREEGLFDIYVKVVESGTPARREFYYNQDGIDCWFENIAIKLGDGFAVTFRDITNVKQSEQALYQANQQLEENLDDLTRRNDEMILLSETSDFLQACLSLEEACTVITNLVEPLFPYCSGSIFITSESRDRVENIASWGDHLLSQTSFYPHSCWGLRRGRPHFVGQHRAGLRCKHVGPAADIADTLCIPMIAQGETLGLFYLSAETPTALSPAKQRLARTVAEQVALAVANLRLREILQHQSIRDPLTGLFNRRYLEESLDQEIARAQRHQRSIGVIMVDVDHFKRFNDTYGHEAGDHVLQAIGKLLREGVRKSDIVCRYGGEELTLVLPESSLEDTQVRAEALRAAVSNLEVYHDDRILDSVTASFGVACFPQHGATSANLLQAADVALYRAKDAGRNRVLVFP